MSKEISNELYNEALEFVVEMKTVNVTLMQRRFRLGYTAAAKIIEQLEDQGIVGPRDLDNFPHRKVLLSVDAFNELNTDLLTAEQKEHFKALFQSRKESR